MNASARQTQAARPMRALAGRTALVTGSTSGIGLGVAAALAAEGANLVLNGFGEPEAVERTRSELAGAHGVEVAYSDADLSRPDGARQMMAFAQAALGPIDILVNNAGVQHVAPIESFPETKWEAILAINLSSAFYAMQSALPSMRTRRYGRIVNIASAHGLVASPFKSAYVAAKHGLVGLTKVAALETATDRITCNAICPGYVWTPLVEKQIEDQAKAHGVDRETVINDILLAAQPNKRFATVEEIGALVVFLCTEAGASITGTALPVDGGWTAH
jgi:3-hydroxybutyrate dehydrogenase